MPKTVDTDTLVHVGRMGNERLPKRMLFARTEEGHRNRGKPSHGQSWPGMILFRFGNTGGTRAARIELTGGTEQSEGPPS